MKNTDIAVWKIGKWRDLPPDFRCAFDAIEGAVPDVAYQNGRFYKLVNVRAGGWSGMGCQNTVKIPLDEMDALVIEKDWGVKGRILGGLFL